MERLTQNNTRVVLLTFLGLLGVFSLLTNEIPLDNIPAVVLDKLTVAQLKYLSLINPLVLLGISILIGSVTHKKVGLKTFSLLQSESAEVKSNVKSGLLGGAVAFALIMGVNSLFKLFIKDELTVIDSSNYASIWARIFYGGFTEEILLRFGLMTFIVWLGYKITNKTQSSIYWIGIILAAAIFALGHFPTVFLLIKTPSLALLSYIFLGNFIGGLIFGWLYWKKGLDIAFIAHIVFHLCLLTITNIFTP